MILCFYHNTYHWLLYICIEWQIPSLIPFSIINNILISVNNSNFIPVFLNLLTMLIQVLIENDQDQVQIFQSIYF